MAQELGQGQTQANASGAVGMWLNKRSVSRVDITVAHDLTSQPAGWRLDVSEPGALVFIVDHQRVPVDLEPGDYVLASGDDLYVSIQRTKDDRKQGGEGGQGRGTQGGGHGAS